jgi:hypothetical protein
MLPVVLRTMTHSRHNRVIDEVIVAHLRGAILFGEELASLRIQTVLTVTGRARDSGHPGPRLEWKQFF